PGQQHVVRAGAAEAGGLEDETELVADPGLAVEVVQALGAQRRLELAVLGVRQRVHLGVLHGAAHLRASELSAARIRVPMAMPGSSSTRCATLSQAAAASRADQPSPCSPSPTCSRHASPRVDDCGAAAAPDSSSGSRRTLSLSSI